ncbi:MAG TPA: hypothetical protein VJP08_05615 [Actinomycetota bacterium]|nr:hypothetical protein [Actinomycetota bacterium]
MPFKPWRPPSGEIRTLSELFGKITDGLKVPQVHLKTDTQGLDLEVVEGAVDVLGRGPHLADRAVVPAHLSGKPGWLDVLGRLGKWAMKRAASSRSFEKRTPWR